MLSLMPTYGRSCPEAPRGHERPLVDVGYQVGSTDAYILGKCGD